MDGVRMRARLASTSKASFGRTGFERTPAPSLQGGASLTDYVPIAVAALDGVPTKQALNGVPAPSVYGGASLTDYVPIAVAALNPASFGAS